MHRRLTLAVAAAAAVASVGCSSIFADEVGEADPTAADVTVVADDVVFVDPPSTLPSGELVLAIDNRGSAMHDLTMDGRAGVIASARGGQRTAGDVTLEPGTYTIYCSIAGHRQAGMEFDITVG